jgi:hypothetical protein
LVLHRIQVCQNYPPKTNDPPKEKQGKTRFNKDAFVNDPGPAR